MTALKHKKVYGRVIMARKGRRHSGKRLQPPLPDAKDEPVIPKYFSMIRGSGYNKAEEERREIIPGPMPRAGETPRPIAGRRPLLPISPFPGPAPEPEKLPLLIRAARYFATILGVEPERPIPMPVVPELNFPALYTRFPTMKTVTKTTDAAGEIVVTYSHSFATIPGVVITVKDPDNVFGTVFTTTVTGFEARMFKMAHDHGGIVDDGGAHTPYINADGDHVHNVQGTGSLSLDTNYGRLVLANYTDYETAHVHTQVQTQLEDAHTHHVYPTTSAGAHTHSIPHTNGPDDIYLAVSGLNYGCECSEACGGGDCVTGVDTDWFAGHQHWHYFGSPTGSGGAHTHPNITTAHGSAHRHLLNSTGAAPSPGHRHLISNDGLYNHYVYNVDLTLDLWASAKEDPYHAHTGADVPVHAHDVPEDGRVLLKNTNVTITYMAQEEED